MATNTAFIDIVQKFIDKVSSSIKGVHYVSNTPIAAGQTLEFNITTLFTDHAEYDLLSTRVTVLVLDTEVGSVTQNMYINSEAVILTGINSAGLVKVHNSSNSSVMVNIRINKPTAKL